MDKSKKKITNWSEYNKALCNQGQLRSGTMTQPLRHGDARPTMINEVEAFSFLIPPLKQL